LLPGESPSNDAEIEFHRRHVQKLESKLRKVESEKVSSKRTKDIKKFRIEISTIRRKLRNLGVDISDHEPTKSENAVDSGTETEPLETTNGHLHNGPSLNGSSNVSPSSSSGIGVDRPDDYGNSNGNAHKNGIEDELDLKEIEENNRVADPLLKERKNHLNGPKIEENGNIPHASDHSDREDLQEDVEVSLSYLIDIFPGKRSKFSKIYFVNIFPQSEISTSLFI
jgi:chromosome segregation ATPase